MRLAMNELPEPPIAQGKQQTPHRQTVGNLNGRDSVHFGRVRRPHYALTCGFLPDRCLLYRSQPAGPVQALCTTPMGPLGTPGQGKSLESGRFW